MEPVLEEVRDRLWQLATLPGRAIDEGGGGGELERVGVVVGVILDATRQYSSKLSAAEQRC